jgi:hypothetical protein
MEEAGEPGEVREKAMSTARVKGIPFCEPTQAENKPFLHGK